MFSCYLDRCAIIHAKITSLKWQFNVSFASMALVKIIPSIFFIIRFSIQAPSGICASLGVALNLIRVWRALHRSSSMAPPRHFNREDDIFFLFFLQYSHPPTLALSSFSFFIPSSLPRYLSPTAVSPLF